MNKLLHLTLAGLLAVSAAQAEENTLKEGAKEVGRATGNAVREVGQGAKKVATQVGHATRDAAKEVGHASRDGAKEFAKAVKGESNPAPSGADTAAADSSANRSHIDK